MENTVTPQFPVNAREIAKTQKGIMKCLLAQLGLYFLLFLLGFLDVTTGSSITENKGVLALGRLSSYGLHIFITVYTYDGTKYLGYSGTKRILLAFLCLACCGPLVLIYVNAAFIKVLRAAGLKVGFLGVNLADIPPENNRR
jgi:hypothetical protein